MKKLVIFCTLVALMTLAAPFLPLSGEERVYTGTVRLHVIANSDSETDQALKLCVRDAVLTRVGELTECAGDRAEAEENIRAALGEIETLAADELAAQGSEYRAEAVLEEEYYPERRYEGVALPAGRYLSLKICIGAAEGRNWWCVLYPPLCTGTAEPRRELAEAGFTGEQIRVLCEDENPKYVLRFRILEFFAGLFS